MNLVRPKCPGLLGPYQYRWPVTYRWTIRLPWGSTQTELTVSAPYHFDRPEQTGTLGFRLFDGVIARAISREAQLTVMEWMSWRVMVAPSVADGQRRPGRLDAEPSARAQTPCVVLHSGHPDSCARRRLYLPGAPREYSAEGLLTEHGLGSLQTHLRGVWIALNGPLLGTAAELLIPSYNAMPKGGDNFHGVGFRNAAWLRLPRHTARAPEQASLAWPPLE